MDARIALIAASRSSALMGLVFLVLTIPHWVSLGFRSVERSYAMVIEPAFAFFGCEISEIIIFKSCQQKELCILLDGCIDCGLQKTQWTNMAAQIVTSSDRKLYIGLQMTWALCLSAQPPDSGNLLSKWLAEVSWATVQWVFLHSSGKTLLRLSPWGGCQRLSSGQ